ncbi:unnamed protein product, partial [Hapterophycus canaliculatus]
MSEPDWRTAAKALYLFQRMVREMSVEQHEVFEVFLGKMSRERDKKTGRKYFDKHVLCDLDEEGEAFCSFLERYGTYVFNRAEDFDGRFQ